MRTTAVARRILQQLGRDRRTVAMILFAPILILSLVWLIFDGDPYPTKVALVNVPPPLATALAAEDLEVVNVNSAQAEALIRADEVDAVLTFGGPSLAVLLEGSKPLARQSVMIALQAAMAGLAPTSSPITPQISFLHGDAEMAPFDSFGPVLLGLIVFMFTFMISGISFVRERTSGTLERMMATPLRRWEVVLGYILAFSVVMGVQVALITSVSVFLLDMMLVGSFVWLLVITMLLAATALTLGMLLSAAARVPQPMTQLIRHHARFAATACGGAAILAILPGTALAAEETGLLDFTGHWAAFLALGLFFLAYVLVIGEERLDMRKSKPVMVAAGVTWLIVAILYNNAGASAAAEEAVRHNLLEFVELFLFLLAAMTYINTMDERGLFDALRGWLVSRGFSYRAIFWVTGILSFVMSPIADNLTTALLMATVVLAVAGDNHRFIVIACVNIVVAANAGGAFSPFGDITTLMVWQRGLLEIPQFLLLFPASVVNWLIPAVIMSFVIKPGRPDPFDEHPVIREGAWVIVGLFLVTVAMAVSAHSFLGMPPVLGMMTGLGFLKLYGYYLKRRSDSLPAADAHMGETGLALSQKPEDEGGGTKPFNVFKALERAEWDTLMFFYGIILCVGGLGTLGFLAVASEAMYGGLGPTTANILVGIASAVVDNIPVMFAVLAVLPEMSDGQWLLVTLTAGVGGSMLSIGSAAGVAVMGQARGIYTFVAHLKWTWAIALGYAASIWVHIFINGSRF